MSSLRAGMFQLFCFILGEPESTFHVDIADTETVSHLRDDILKKNRNALGKVDSSQLKLYKHYIRPFNLRTQVDNLQLSDEDLLDATAPLSSTFHDASRGDIHVIVVVDRRVKRKLDADDLERKHKRQHAAHSEARRWAVNGSLRQIDLLGCYHLDPGLQKASTDCLTAVKNGQFVLLSGARASGKSTRLLWLEEKLESLDYEPAYFSFEAIAYNGTVDRFWRSLGSAIQRSFRDKTLRPIVNQETFLDAFRARDWQREIVILIDELSELHSASGDIRDDFLRTLREIRNNARAYAIKSVVAAGTFSILSLHPSKSSISPFNISDRIDNPYFTEEEAKTLFTEFARDYRITIEAAVVEDIWVKSNGHPGMVCLFGRTIHNNLKLLLNNSSTVSHARWQRYPIQDLYHEVVGYPTFKSLEASLMKPTSVAALGLFRSHFAGYLRDVRLSTREEIDLADFLTTEGVLLRPDGRKPVYHMASPLLDGYIRSSILPAKFSRTPSITPPTQIKNSRATLHVLEVLKGSLKYFDKDTIRLAVSRSYKTALVKVGSLSSAPVARESVYDTELIGILSNWLQVNTGWSVTGQWHLRNALDKHKYTNVVLQKDKNPMILFELLATGTPSVIRSHIEKTPEYKFLLAADEAWVVHFTCQDDFRPTWQSDADLDAGVNVVHFAHDIGFTRVQMSARFKDAVGNVTLIADELLSGI